MKTLFLSLSIVIPVFNEENRLSKTFAELKEFFKNYSLRDTELIFVDDGSQDQTVNLIKQFRAGCPVKLISYAPNRGKGYAVRQGMLAAKNDYVLMLDADMSTEFSELGNFLPRIEEGIPVIIGSRKKEGAKVARAQSWSRRKLGEGYTFLANLILGVWVSDFTCGFKCFSKEAAQKIFSRTAINRWSYDAEALFLARKFGFAIREIPVIWRNDDNTRVRLKKDILESLIDLLKIRLKRY